MQASADRLHLRQRLGIALVVISFAAWFTLLAIPFVELPFSSVTAAWVALAISYGTWALAIWMLGPQLLGFLKARVRTMGHWVRVGIRR